MKINYTKVCNQYGASMGRRNSYTLIGKCHLQRVPLDSGGYDPGGAYWGIGEPLYVAQDSYGNWFFLRAATRDAAKEMLHRKFGNQFISFYK